MHATLEEVGIEDKTGSVQRLFLALFSGVTPANVHEISVDPRLKKYRKRGILSWDA